MRSRGRGGDEEQAADDDDEELEVDPRDSEEIVVVGGEASFAGAGTADLLVESGGEG